jgi:hypothetical protein
MINAIRVTTLLSLRPATPDGSHQTAKMALFQTAIDTRKKNVS